MTDVGFYHLTRSKLEQALPKLLEKTMAAEKRAVVVLGSKERVEWLDNLLWVYDPASWLPHGSERTGDAPDQPIWITHADENPNTANFLFLADGGTSDGVAGFERCFEVFDGHNLDAVQAARGRWKAYKEAGHTLAYWQQNERGGWEKKQG